MAVPSSDELQTAARREKPILETRSLDGSRPIVKTPYLNISASPPLSSVAADTQQPLESEDASDL